MYSLHAMLFVDTSWNGPLHSARMDCVLHFCSVFFCVDFIEKVNLVT